MTRLRTFLLRLWALLRSRQMDRDIDDNRQPSCGSDRGVHPTGAFPGETRAADPPNVAGVFLQGWDLSAMALASDAGPPTLGWRYNGWRMVLRPHVMD